MSTTMPDILAAALALPESDRAAIAYELLGTLKPPSIWYEDDPGFEAELQRRIDEHEKDPSRAEDWDVVSQRIRDALEKRKNP